MSDEKPLSETEILARMYADEVRQINEDATKLRSDLEWLRPEQDAAQKALDRLASREKDIMRHLAVLEGRQAVLERLARLSGISLPT